MRMEAFANYAAERFRERLTERVYRCYVTDSLRAIPRGEHLVKRYAELFEQEPDFDAMEVIARITESAGLEVRHNEPTGPDGENRHR